MPSCMPFIMPDGRRLTQLFEHEADQRKRKGKGTGSSQRLPFPLEPQNEYEAAEFEVASKLGSRRLGRWLNDRLLRRLAGTNLQLLGDSA
jgi:hypothetical protein